MSTRIEKLLLGGAYKLNWLLPKRKNQVFFYSSPDYSDSARALFEEMRRQGLIGKYNVVWAVKDLKRFTDTRNVKFVRHRSLNNLWHFCRSHYLIRTHSLWGNRYVQGRQIMCVAWHGMPLKRLGSQNGNRAKAVRADYLTTTAEAFHDEFVASMGIDSRICMDMGLPRNDFLFRKSDVLQHMFPGYDQYVIWMPTFRKAAGFDDGCERELGIPILTRANLQPLNEALRKRNTLLLLKLHPWAADKLAEIRFDHIVNLRDSDIPLEHSLYELIGQTDALITDYSSIYIDYLLIDKPICFAYDDLEQYKESRGFVFEPVESVMPGARVTTFEALLDWLGTLDGEDAHRSEREALRNRFHKFQDDQSSARVLTEMGIV